MRRLDSEIDNFKRREEAAAHARAEIESNLEGHKEAQKAQMSSWQ